IALRSPCSSHHSPSGLKSLICLNVMLLYGPDLGNLCFSSRCLSSHRSLFFIHSGEQVIECECLPRSNVFLQGGQSHISMLTRFSLFLNVILDPHHPIPRGLQELILHDWLRS